MQSKPIFHFKFMDKKYKACYVTPAYEGTKYDPQSDIVVTKYGKSFTRCDLVEYNPDIEIEARVSFETLIMILMSRKEE